MDRELFAVYKAKALAYDCLDVLQPWTELADGHFAVKIEDLERFVQRSAVAHKMTERYKNRDNIVYRR